MRAAELLRELAYPFTELAIVLAMLFFYALFWLSERAGVVGIGLLIIAVPAYLRYLVLLLEERAHGRPAPVPSVETFSLWSDPWALATLVHVAAVIAAITALEYVDVPAANVILAIATALVLPAAFAVLAVTHSPLESLNPLAIARMLRACGPTYFVVPASLLAVSGLLMALERLGLPDWFGNVGSFYVYLLAFSLTGAVLHRRGIIFEVGLEVSDHDDMKAALEDLEKQRQNVANHAYGFISRGNREGGLAHIRDWLQKEADASAAAQWYFNEMMRWEQQDAALRFGQDCLSHFLHHGEEQRALKLISACLHADGRWKPLPDDRPAVMELAEQYSRHDLQRLIEA